MIGEEKDYQNVDGWVEPPSSTDPTCPAYEASPVFLQLYLGPGERQTWKCGSSKAFISITENTYRITSPDPVDDIKHVFRCFSDHIERIQLGGASNVTVFGAPDKGNAIGLVPRLKWKCQTQHVYEIGDTLSLEGHRLKTLREKVNRFRSENDLKEICPTPAIIDKVFASWKKTTELKEDQLWGMEERIEITKQLDDITLTAYELNGEPVSIQGAFYTSSTTASHFLGICSKRIPGLNEVAQLEFWKQLHSQGIELVNDGPTWDRGLESFKKKFKPVKTFRLFNGYSI